MRDEKIGREAMTVFALACVARAMLPVLGIARTARTEWGGGERITALGQNANNSAMILGAGLIALLALQRSEEHTSELQSQSNLECRLLLGQRRSGPEIRMIFTRRVTQQHRGTEMTVQSNEHVALLCTDRQLAVGQIAQQQVRSHQLRGVRN